MMVTSPERSVDTVPTSGPRIFVVDDEEVIATSLAAILKISGFDASESFGRSGYGTSGGTRPPH